MPGDYDGDGRTDISVYRPATGFWYFINSSTNSTVPSIGDCLPIFRHPRISTRTAKPILRFFAPQPVFGMYCRAMAELFGRCSGDRTAMCRSHHVLDSRVGLRPNRSKLNSMSAIIAKGVRAGDHKSVVNKEKKMKNKKKTDLNIGCNHLRGFAAIGVAFKTQPVKAFNPQPDPPGYGMVGITQGQSLRVNVVNTTPPDINLPPDPIRAVLTFRTAAGELFRNGEGNPIRRVVLLNAGESGIARPQRGRFCETLRRQRTSPAAAGRCRYSRLMELTEPPPDPCLPSVEVINNANADAVYGAVYSGRPAHRTAITTQTVRPADTAGRLYYGFALDKDLFRSFA